MNHRFRLHLLFVSLILSLSLAVEASAGTIDTPKPAGVKVAAAAPASDRPSVDELMTRLLAKYKQGDKKYEALAAKIDKDVRKALTSTFWLSEQDAGVARTYATHPLFALIEQLSRAAQASPTGAEAKQRTATRDILLAKYPWGSRLELDQGLDYGSDRPVPPHEAGFIAMGNISGPMRGFPELLTNQYLYGLQEIVGWRTSVKPGKKVSFEGREAKKPASVETELPGFEWLRVLLSGSLPEVPLFAMPEMTHAIHSRLVERRKAASGELSRMDEEFAYFDSRWNGFAFTTPYSKERFAVVQPVLSLMTDRTNFFYGFPESEHMAKVGDLPFLSIQMYARFAELFLGQKIPPGEFVANSAAALAAGKSLQADSMYLVRYKTLIDELVRAVLLPTLPYPGYLAFLDYPPGKLPTARAAEPELDVSRKYAVLVWASVGKDPAKLADFLFDKVLELPENKFPANVGLAAAFTTAARKWEPEMLRTITTRIADERTKASVAGATAGKTSDYEREFSPYAAYLDVKGEPSAACVLASFQAVHSQAAALVQDLAYSAALKEAGK